MKQYLQIKKIALTIALSFGNSMASAQAPAIQWDKAFGGNFKDESTDFVITSDGGYILGGRSFSDVSGDKTNASKGLSDFWVVKLNASGTKLWDKTIGGGNYDDLSTLIQTPDGGYMLGGYSYSGISGDKSQANKGNLDYWVVKLDASGNKLWDKSFGGSTTDILARLIQTSDGGFILGGSSSSWTSADKTEASKGYSDYWVIKLDVNGNKLWDKTIGGNANDELSTISQTPDGGYVLGGCSYSGISGDKSQASFGFSDYWVVKLDATGNKLWDISLGGNGGDYLYSLDKTLDGGFILGGTSGSGISTNKSESSKGGLDYWLIKLNANGNKVWDKTIGGNAPDALTHIIQIPDGSFILAGISESSTSGDKSEISRGNKDYWVVKSDANGNKIWDKTIGGNAEDVLSTIALTSDGGYILGGFSESGIFWNKTQPSQGGIDYWIVKLGPDATTGINESTTSFNLSISPNPSQGKFKLQINNLMAKSTAITVSDLVGRIVYQQQIPVSDKQLSQQINLPHVKGMYLLQVKAGTHTITRKIIVE